MSLDYLAVFPMSVGMNRHLFEREQDKKIVDDLWHSPIETWVEDVTRTKETGFTGAQILHGALRKDIGHGSQMDYKRIGDVMKIMGWDKRKMRWDGSLNPVWVYVRPPKNNAPAAKNGGLNSEPSASGGLSEQEFQNWEDEL